MNRPGIRVATAVVAAAGAAVFAAPATAAAASSRPDWQPFRSSITHTAPGDPCSFGITSTPVLDGEEFRVLATHPDGSPALEQFRGPLIVRYTNDDTGTSVVRDLSGRAWFHFGSDGSFTGLFLDNGGVTVHAGNRGFPVGEWVFHGPFRVTDNGPGTREVHLFHATAENLCETLG
jgi:hypothetical protein